jgi:hypothetical protein
MLTVPRTPGKWVNKGEIRLGIQGLNAGNWRSLAESNRSLHRERVAS